MFLDALVVLILLLILIMIIFVDYALSKGYKNAIVCPGVVIQSYGIERRNDYGGSPTVKRKIPVEKYLVNYEYNYQVYQGDVESVRTGLMNGTPIDVHFRISSTDGRHIIYSDLYPNRLKRFLISTIIGVIFGLICVYLVSHGYI